MELAGKVIAVLEPRGGVSKTGNEWKVQEYVIETHDQYPKKMCFDVFGADKIAQFNIQAGEELNVFFDVDAREWNGRWFNSIRAWMWMVFLIVSWERKHRKREHRFVLRLLPDSCL